MQGQERIADRLERTFRESNERSGYFTTEQCVQAPPDFGDFILGTLKVAWPAAVGAFVTYKVTEALKPKRK